MASCNLQGFRHSKRQQIKPKSASVSNIDWKLVLSTVVAPAIAILVPLCIRAYKKTPQSTAADVFAFICVLDIAIIAEADRFAIPLSNEMRADLPTLAGISILISAVFWISCQFIFDENILRHHDRSVVRKAVENHNVNIAAAAAPVTIEVPDESDFALLWLALQWLIAWGACLALLVLHAEILSGGAYPWR